MKFCIFGKLCIAFCSIIILHCAYIVQSGVLENDSDVGIMDGHRFVLEENVFEQEVSDEFISEKFCVLLNFVCDCNYVTGDSYYKSVYNTEDLFSSETLKAFSELKLV